MPLDHHSLSGAIYSLLLTSPGSSFPGGWEVMGLQSPFLWPAFLDHAWYQLLWVGSNTEFFRSRLGTTVWHTGYLLGIERCGSEGEEVGMVRGRSESSTCPMKLWPQGKELKSAHDPSSLSHLGLKRLGPYAPDNQSVARLPLVETDQQRWRPEDADSWGTIRS